MADKPDPNHLVALMCCVFGSQQDGSARRLDHTTVEPKHGVTKKLETSIRTFPVLDAFASIGVFEEKSQVMAVALQLDSDEEAIRLTIAENGDVDPRVVHHLGSVWGKLQALSSKFGEGRDPEEDKDEKGSPRAPADVAIPLRVELFREIYQFSLAKQMKRVRKWWNRLLGFMDQLIGHRKGVLEGFELDLRYVVAWLGTVFRLVPKLHHDPPQQLTDDEWGLVYDHSMCASEKLKSVLAHRKNFGCENLANKLHALPLSRRPAEAFRLRRALEKLISLTRRIECLISFANSPRLKPALQYRMSIFAVPGQTRTVELPGSEKQWRTFLEVAAAKTLPEQEGDAKKLARKFKDNICVCPVHCECALIQYLTTRHDDIWDHVPAFSYIGVSKLSCSACRVWLEAFNEVGGREFYTRGSHGKWHWPWGMPTAEESSGEVIAGGSSGAVAPKKSLGETMAAKISRQYIEFLRVNNRYRSSGSDSTVVSLSGGECPPSDAQKESAISAVDEEEEAAGSMEQYFRSMIYNP